MVEGGVGEGEVGFGESVLGENGGGFLGLEGEAVDSGGEGCRFAIR